LIIFLLFMEESTIQDLIVIGGGVVGLAILRSATVQGYTCTLIETEPHLLSHASGSNSGIICTGFDAAPGTIERALIRESNSLFRIYCRDLGISLRPCGSLVCSWPWDHRDDGESRRGDDVSNPFPVPLNNILEECHLAGDTHASILTSSQVLQLEPNLSVQCLGAVHIPGEIVVDPWLFSISLAVHARENGACILTSFEFDPSASYQKDNLWNVVEKNPQNESRLPRRLRGRVIVNAAGLWADVIQKHQFQSDTIHSKSDTHNGMMINTTWTAKPRRGQYRIYSPRCKSAITHPIQPIPTQRTKGIFVFSSIYNQIVVGPTALDQESKTDQGIDPVVAKELDDYAKRIIPGLDPDVDLVGEYVGIRPGTDHRDYQIHVYSQEKWIAAAGIRSTGLTAALGIGNYVVRCLKSIVDTSRPKRSELVVKTTPLPSLPTMVRDYHNRNGEVEIHGNVYKVTHPLTKIGWDFLAKELDDTVIK
jgi:glycerol-3-phosphate dehydrogenase